MHLHIIVKINGQVRGWKQLSIKMDPDKELSSNRQLRQHISIYHKNTFQYCSTFLRNQDCEWQRFYISVMLHHDPFYLELLILMQELSYCFFDHRIDCFLEIKKPNYSTLTLYIEGQLWLIIPNFQDIYLILMHILLMPIDIYLEFRIFYPFLKMYFHFDVICLRIRNMQLHLQISSCI